MRAVRGRADLSKVLEKSEFERRTADETERLAEFFDFERAEPQPQAATPTATEVLDPFEPEAVEQPLAFLPLWRPQLFQSTDADRQPVREPARRIVKWREKPRDIPTVVPLGDPAKIAFRIAQHLRCPRESGRIDIPRLVDRFARAEIIQRLPRQMRSKPLSRIRLVVDRSPHLAPFFEDQRQLSAEIKALFPEMEFDFLLYNLTLGKFIASKDSLNPSTEPGGDDSAWVVLSDFGFGELGHAEDRWLHIGRRLRALSLPAITLPPCKLPLSEAMAALWTVVPLDSRPASQDRAMLVDRLLVLASPAIRIEPGLLRKLRLELVPEADALVEVEFLKHSSIASNAPTAATIGPAKANRLRKQFAQEEHEVQSEALRIIRSWRAALPDEIWFEEILSLDPESRTFLEYDSDLEDALDYYAALAARARPESTVRLTTSERALLSRAGDRVSAAAWEDRGFSEAVWAVKGKDAEHTPPAGSLALPSGERPVVAVRVNQKGGDLVFSASGSEDDSGSTLARLPSDSGLIEIRQTEDDWSDIWRDESPPPWVEAHGEDGYGKWLRFSIEGIPQVMRWCRPGRFTMGSPDVEPGRDDHEGPRQEIVFAEGFWLFETAVTQALWTAVMGSNPSSFESGEKPVENVSWIEANAFIEKCNLRVPGLGLALPSEAQWEYACRAGSTTPFEPTVARRFEGRTATPDEINYDGKYPLGEATRGRYRAETVATKGAPFRANAWGFWHMHGNVWEWCWDGWHDGHAGTASDGSPRLLGEQENGGRDRVVRGGSWNSDARVCRAACRVRFRPDFRLSSVGFRPARGQVMSSGRQESGPEGLGRRSGEVRESEPRAERGRNFSPLPIRARVMLGHSTSVPLPGGPFVIRTDKASLTVARETLGEFNWASAAGRDRFGLWADFDYGRVRQRLRWCPPGRFTMGSPSEEAGRYDDEGPRTEIVIAEGFWLFETPVTQLLYETVMGENPSRFVSGGRPVESVSWEDAWEFVERLNGEVPGLDLVLPSEAQWEYACRAGTLDATWAGPLEIMGANNAPLLDGLAWYGGNSGVDYDLEDGEDSTGWPEKQHDHSLAGTRVVGAKEANPWGLYDMLGNVWEWCWDGWHDGHAGATSDGSPRSLGGQESGGRSRVVRGGSWVGNAGLCRAACRDGLGPDGRNYGVGFRPARGQVMSSGRQESGPEGLGRRSGEVRESEPREARPKNFSMIRA